MSILISRIEDERKREDILNDIIDYKSNKSFRLLNVFERLNKGEWVNKKELAIQFGVSEKTVQRDIEELRSYLAERYMADMTVEIQYDKQKRGYYLVKDYKECLTKEEILALCKIILESRAFCMEEMELMITKLIKQLDSHNQVQLKALIGNEFYHYVPLRHGKRLIQKIWEIAQWIIQQEIIEFIYTRQDNTQKKHRVKPLSIMFSDYYFYLLAFKVEGTDEYPIIFRIDRMIEVCSTKEKFRIPYKERFKEGEFRKRVQFMYAGKLRKILFEYNGPSIEAVLDRLPTAKVINQDGNLYTIKVEVYGKGIDMWMRSQGQYIRVLEDNDE